jgi:RimJ/RimL family protein N-acetyltransferase
MLGYTFIEPTYRGMGWADAFYRVRLDHAVKTLKWKKVITDHRIGNDASRKLILRHGFSNTGKVMIDWPDGSRDYELRYELNLEELRSSRSQMDDDM